MYKTINQFENQGWHTRGGRHIKNLSSEFQTQAAT